jgi:hypothetical protein
MSRKGENAFAVVRVPPRAFSNGIFFTKVAFAQLRAPFITVTFARRVRAVPARLSSSSYYRNFTRRTAETFYRDVPTRLLLQRLAPSAE